MGLMDGLKVTTAVGLSSEEFMKTLGEMSFDFSEMLFDERLSPLVDDGRDSVFSILVEIDTDGVKVRQEVSIGLRGGSKSIYVLNCKALRVFGHSTISLENAKDDLMENIEIFKRVHIDRGTLKDALVSFGWVNAVGDNWEYKDKS